MQNPGSRISSDKMFCFADFISALRCFTWKIAITTFGLCVVATAFADPSDCKEYGKKNEHKNCTARLDKHNEREAKQKTAKHDTRVYRNGSNGQAKFDTSQKGKGILHFSQRPSRTSKGAKEYNGLRGKPAGRYSAVIPKGMTYKEAKTAGGSKSAREILLKKSNVKKLDKGNFHQYNK